MFNELSAGVFIEAEAAEAYIGRADLRSTCEELMSHGIDFVASWESKHGNSVKTRYGANVERDGTAVHIRHVDRVVRGYLKFKDKTFNHRQHEAIAEHLDEIETKNKRRLKGKFDRFINEISSRGVEGQVRGDLDFLTRGGAMIRARNPAGYRGQISVTFPSGQTVNRSVESLGVDALARLVAKSENAEHGHQQKCKVKSYTCGHAAASYPKHRHYACGCIEETRLKKRTN